MKTNQPIIWSDLAASDSDVKKWRRTLASVLGMKCSHVQSKVPSTRHKVRVSVCPTNYLQSTISVQHYHNTQVRGTKSGSVSVRPIIYKAQYLYSNITIPKYEVQSPGQCLSDQLSTKHNICTAISQYPSTRYKVRVSVCPTNYLQSTISVQQYHNTQVRGTKSGSVSVRPIIYKAQYLYSNITIPKYEAQSPGQCLSDQLSTKHNICTAISQYRPTWLFYKCHKTVISLRQYLP